MKKYYKFNKLISNREYFNSPYTKNLEIILNKNFNYIYNIINEFDYLYKSLSINQTTLLIF